MTCACASGDRTTAPAALPALVFPLDFLSEATPQTTRYPQRENPSAVGTDWGECGDPRTPGHAGNMAGRGCTIEASGQSSTGAVGTPDSTSAARPCSPTRTAWRAEPEALSGHRRSRGFRLRPLGVPPATKTEPPERARRTPSSAVPSGPWASCGAQLTLSLGAAVRAWKRAGRTPALRRDARRFQHTIPSASAVSTPSGRGEGFKPSQPTTIGNTSDPFDHSGTHVTVRS